MGSVTIDGMIDGKVTRVEPKPEPRESMFERYGSELLKQPVSPVDDIPDEAKLDG